MRQKTYPTPEEQWDRTVEFGMSVASEYWTEPYPPWWIGQIVGTHPLFVPGDLVLVHCSNGMAERQPVWGVSSKGFTVAGQYLRYSAFSNKKVLTTKYYRRWNKVLRKLILAKKRCRRSLKVGTFGHGPLRLIELPEHLVGLPPDAPAVRQHIVALAREGCRKPGKRE